MFRHASRINTLKDQIIPFINHFFSHLIPSFSILSLKIIQRNFERNKRFQVEKSFRVKVQNMKNISILRLHKMWILDAKKKIPFIFELHCISTLHCGQGSRIDTNCRMHCYFFIWNLKRELIHSLTKYWLSTSHVLVEEDTKANDLHMISSLCSV